MYIIDGFRRFFVYVIIFIMIVGGVVPSILSVKSNIYNSDRKIGNFNGYILFAPRISTETYHGSTLSF